MLLANSDGYRANYTVLEETAALFAAHEAGASRTRVCKATGRTPPRSRPRHVRPQRRWDAARIEPRMARPELAPEEQHLAEIVGCCCERGTRGLQGSLSLWPS